MAGLAKQAIIFYNQALKDDQIPSRHTSQFSSFDSSSETSSNSKRMIPDKKNKLSNIDAKIEEIFRRIDSKKSAVHTKIKDQSPLIHTKASMITTPN